MILTGIILLLLSFAVTVRAQTQCQLCVDGSKPKAECQEYADQIFKTEFEGTFGCVEAQLVGVIACGCPAPTPGNGTCGFCASDIVVPLVRGSAVGSNQTVLSTCEELELFVAPAFAEQNRCPDFSARYSAWCECGQTDCKLCPGGEKAPFTQRPIPLGQGLTCEALDFQFWRSGNQYAVPDFTFLRAQVVIPLCDKVVPDLFGTRALDFSGYCGCNEGSNPSGCELCQQGLPEPDRMVAVAGSNFVASCLEIQEFGKFITANQTCSEFANNYTTPCCAPAMTAQPTPSPTPFPTRKPTPEPSSQPSDRPTVTESDAPSSVPSPRPTPSPTTAQSGTPSEQPSVSSPLSAETSFLISVEGGLSQTVPSDTYIPDLVDAMNELATQVSSGGRNVRKRKLGVSLQLPAVLKSAIVIECPQGVATTDRCENITAAISLITDDVDKDVTREAFKEAFDIAIHSGRLQQALDKVNVDSLVTILTSSMIAQSSKVQSDGLTTGGKVGVIVGITVAVAIIFVASAYIAAAGAAAATGAATSSPAPQTPPKKCAQCCRSCCVNWFKDINCNTAIACVGSLSGWLLLKEYFEKKIRSRGRDGTDQGQDTSSNPDDGTGSDGSDSVRSDSNDDETTDSESSKVSGLDDNGGTDPEASGETDPNENGGLDSDEGALDFKRELEEQGRVLDNEHKRFRNIIAEAEAEKALRDLGLSDREIKRRLSLGHTPENNAAEDIVEQEQPPRLEPTSEDVVEQEHPPCMVSREGVPEESGKDEQVKSVESGEDDHTGQ